MDRRAGVRLLSVQLERDRGAPLERRHVEAIAELARPGFEIPLGEVRLAKLHLDLGHHEERRAALLVVGEEAREDLARFAQRHRIALLDGARGAHVGGVLVHLERVERVAFVAAPSEVAQVAQVAQVAHVFGGRRRPLRARPLDRGDNRVRVDRRRHRTALVDHDVGDVHIAGARVQDHGHHPSLAHHAADAPDVLNLEQAPEFAAEERSDRLPDLLAGHDARLAGLRREAPLKPHGQPRSQRPGVR